MAQSSIEWTQMTWNPTTGCKHCYAEEMTKRLLAMGQEKYKDGFAFRMHDQVVNIPYTWTKPKLVFVNSMSDLFHKDVTLEFVQRVFAVMNNTPQHTYQILTKRGDVLERFAPSLTFTPNIWMGVSVENQKVVSRIDSLREVNASVRFLSLEPLLGPLPDLNLAGIHWVIVGGESGRKARPVNPKWVEGIRLQCEQSKVKFFFKQWGGTNKKRAGRILNGRTYDEMPTM
jgi:protein gp37